MSSTIPWTEDILNAFQSVNLDRELIIKLIQEEKFGYIEELLDTIKKPSTLRTITSLENQEPLWGKSLLHLACCRGKLSIAKLLIEAGVRVDIVDVDNQTPLHYAVKSNFSKLIEILIFAGSDVNYLDKEGNTPFHYAIENANEESCKLLIAGGAKYGGEEFKSILNAVRTNYFFTRTNKFMSSILCNFHFTNAILTEYTDIIKFSLSLGRYNPDDDSAITQKEYVLTHISKTPEMVSLINLAWGGWSPKSHHLHHLGVREAIQIVLLCDQRIASSPDGSTIPKLHRLIDGSILPHELWLYIFSFISRKDWEVPPLTL